VPAIPGVAVTFAEVPAHTVGLFTVTVGFALMVTVPETEVLEQLVKVFVMTTEYNPLTVGVKDATLPGFVAAPGTSQT
jgi:hypothetical protein